MDGEMVFVDEVMIGQAAYDMEGDEKSYYNVHLKTANLVIKEGTPANALHMNDIVQKAGLCKAFYYDGSNAAPFSFRAVAENGATEGILLGRISRGQRVYATGRIYFVGSGKVLILDRPNLYIADGDFLICGDKGTVVSGSIT